MSDHPTHCKAIFDFFGFYRVMEVPFPPPPRFTLAFVKPLLTRDFVINDQELEVKGTGVRHLDFELYRHCGYPVHWAEYRFASRGGAR